MEEKEKKQENDYSLTMHMFAELRKQIARQIMFIYVLIFVIAALLGYIFYDRWLDSQVESEYTVTTDSEIHQDNMTNSDGSGHRVITNAQ